MGDVNAARVFEVGTILKVARVFGGLSVDDAGEVGADDVVGAVFIGEVVVEHVLHGLRELLEANGVAAELGCVGAGDGLVV